jgi:hypothetical protein
MTSSESARNQLYDALVPILGTEPTETLMSHLLPIPNELEILRSEMIDRFDAVDSRFERMEERFNERFDRMLLAQIGGYAALVVAILLD